MASPVLLVHLLVLLEVLGAEASSWTVTVPSKVTGLLGSCVVIPCSYRFPDSSKTITKFTGIWRDGSEQTIFHPQDSKIQQRFKARTALVGDVSQKNCSLKISPLRPGDHGPFHFRIELAGYDNFSYREKEVSITMLSQPEPIIFTLEEEANLTMRATCSVSHSCPSSPPAFTWSRAGRQEVHPQQLSDGLWNLTSTLTFHPSHTDHGKSLWCAVRHKGGQRQNNSRTLEVKYAPVKVEVEHEAEVREGDSTLLRCRSEANPPPTGILWFDVSGALLASGENYTLANVSRRPGAVFCSASNALGSRMSNMLQLNVTYAPEIRPVSSCFVRQNLVRCDCIAESRPPGTVRFLISGREVQSKVERHGDFTMATLETDLESSRSVVCLVENSVGRSSAELSPPGNRRMKTIYIVAFIAGAAIFVIAFTVGLRKCVQSSSAAPVLHLSALEDRRTPPTDLACSSDSKQLYDEARKPSVSSEHVYGNTEEQAYMEADGDAIYANV